MCCWSSSSSQDRFIREVRKPEKIQSQEHVSKYKYHLLYFIQDPPIGSGLKIYKGLKPSFKLKKSCRTLSFLKFIVLLFCFEIIKLLCTWNFGNFKMKMSSRIDQDCNLDLWIVVKFETSENWISRSD